VTTLTPPRSALDAGDFRLDRAVWPAVEAMSVCLCSTLNDSGLGDLCFCGVFPGAQPYDQMGDGTAGQAWVRVVRVYPSNAFPQIEQDPRRSCASGLAVEMELGVLRCAPMPADSGRVPPTMSAQWDATRLQMADMAAMQRAVQCCYTESDLVMLGNYTPTGPAGGVVGGTWQVFVSAAATPGPAWGVTRG
jgi:hypothetical protein